MGSMLIHHLKSAWHVDQAILFHREEVVAIRFGRDGDPECMVVDEQLAKIAPKVANFAAIYLVDLDQVPDFNSMYELYDPCSVLFFWRNKHMLCDFGTGKSKFHLFYFILIYALTVPQGNNNKLNFPTTNKQELIDIIETIYRGAKKGHGLVVSPKDYSFRHKY
ncbi:mitosis protein DIM1-domain-containing protein [Clohesyomyces aquaticus]|uniref:Spliceosomal protein DIB1 n=1 Tax=Clohesyomyces aquaticus TaxID=1231657 RepID=A0A1Y2A364_9PLEO|nr:mitosis protein DIM1-domain-containing protein [Clohesyomyces aquaticus]